MTKRASHSVLWLKVTTHAASLAPLIALMWAYWQDALGPDPIREVTLRTGRYALIFLILSLVPTVISKIRPLRVALRLRRAIGLYAALYAALHFLSYAGLDYGFDPVFLPQALLEGRREQLGLGALIILAPLALTSTNGWMKRLGRRWKRLHRLVYLAGILAVLHYVYRFKELRVAPILAGVALAILLLLRLPPIANRIRSAR